MSGTPPRLNVFLNGNPSHSCVVLVNHSSLEELLNSTANKLGCETLNVLYNKYGAKVTSLDVIRDDDTVFASRGEPFQGHSNLKRTKNKSDWITLNIGGYKFTTTKRTLTSKEPNSMLARMFSETDDNQWLSSVDETGAYLIDRNGLYVSPIINYLRHGELIIDESVNPAGVLEEAKFFGIASIIPQLENLVQGLNFSGADLSKLDLRFVNFKYANLNGTNLSGANLSNANFERADLTNAILDGANMMGTKMLCAQLEGASLKGCNFEDPAGSKANMEGANLKHVNLEGSHMAGVNLRVATMRNSNLKNCDLRGAVLAGADLENCDLSGCDLQEANLRGANLEGAAFAMMLNALHMSQTLKS